MFGGVKKKPVHCPHCGFEQLEPAGVLSTYCRGCGDHYAVGPGERQHIPAFTSLAGTPVLGPKQQRRRVRCHECERTHIIPVSSRATHCPGCGVLIDLANVEIAVHTTRRIDTRGVIRVANEGFLNATSTHCGHAIIDGRIAGRIRCEGTLRFRGSDFCRGRITARKIIVDRHTQLRFIHPIHAENVLVHGVMEADVICTGTIRIGRHGSLEGDVQARSLIVDSGGSYHGSVQVTTSVSYLDPEPRNEDRPLVPQVMPAWQPNLAFG